MKTQIISLQKYAIAFLAAVLVMAVFATPAAAATYYYPQPTVPYYQVYQPPVYQYQIQNTAQLLAYLQTLMAQLEALQKQYNNQYGHSYGGGSGNYYGGDYDIDVETLYARDVRDDEATLFGEIDLDGASYADVWFEYGEGGDLDEESDDARLTSSQDDRFDIDIDGLDDDENYYFRAVAEAPNGDRAYGQIKSFTANHDDDDDDDNDSNGDEPFVETGDATDIEDDSARIEGEVEMNDFDSGDVFFVYGEDEDLVEDVENENSYSDIDEDGDWLQKYSVYDNLDGDRSFWLEVFGLEDSTDHYYRLCVEYEDDDGDDTLECGDVEHFETD